ncbi:MAG: formylglycine-generating enzyme family protein [Prevotella sp.]|nr:formylglycine-generating enzyme family protein [Prevotella sp.]
MKQLLTLLFAFLLAVPTLGQIRMPPCPTCGKKVNLCPYHGKHPAPKPQSKPTAKPKPKPKPQPQAVLTPLPDETITVNGVSFVMKGVQGGTFQMGSNESEADSGEKPVHQVTVSSFRIGQTEVTQELWQAVMGANPSYFKGNRRPVEKVSWNDCQDFIRELNRLTGRRFRLPTEAEWEYAACGGNRSSGSKYSGSFSVDNVAWYTSNSGNQTHEVGTKQPNELGLYDMSGNVWEWCNDWYGSYGSTSKTNPAGPSSGSDRVFRGGGWGSNARGCCVSIRGDWKPDGRSRDLGLRLAL